MDTYVRFWLAQGWEFQWLHRVAGSIFGCNFAWNMRVDFFCRRGVGVDIVNYVRFWLAQGWEFQWAHLYQGGFFGCNCAWNMRVDFFFAGGPGWTSMFAFGWLRVGSFSGCICTRVVFLAEQTPALYSPNTAL